MPEPIATAFRKLQNGILNDVEGGLFIGFATMALAFLGVRKQWTVVRSWVLSMSVPQPFKAGVSIRDVFHALHEVDEPLPIALTHRRERLRSHSDGGSTTIPT